MYQSSGKKLGLETPIWKETSARLSRYVDVFYPLDPKKLAAVGRSVGRPIHSSRDGIFPIAISLSLARSLRPSVRPLLIEFKFVRSVLLLHQAGNVCNAIHSHCLARSLRFLRLACSFISHSRKLGGRAKSQRKREHGSSRTNVASFSASFVSSIITYLSLRRI